MKSGLSKAKGTFTPAKFAAKLFAEVTAITTAALLSLVSFIRCSKNRKGPNLSNPILFKQLQLLLWAVLQAVSHQNMVNVNSN
jgi:hypothetical protein